MNKKQFDAAICSNVKGKTGYVISDRGTVYDDYYSNSEFDKFRQDMKTSHPDHYAEYDKGKGSELKEIEKNGKLTPPKMASAASSSRFCYTALVNGALSLGVNGEPKFEHGCRIQGIRGNAPQLDAYFSESNTYFEVKCHEIFDQHKIEFRNSYRNIITGSGNDFDLSENDIEHFKEKSFTVSPRKFGVSKTSPMLDIKQLICHLLGIRSQSNGEQAKLIYLFFYPVTDDEKTNNEIQAVFDELKKEINAVFNSKPIKAFCQKNNIILQAFAEKSTVMKDLKSDNVISLY